MSAVAPSVPKRRPGRPKGSKDRVPRRRQLTLLREEGYGPELDRIDLRFMGAVFRKGWRRVGWVPTGSHARPVAIWEREL